MKPYLLSLGAGLLVGAVYALLGVRSPAPSAIALLGLLGILLGEHGVPLARRLIAPPAAEAPPSLERDIRSPDGAPPSAPAHRRFR